MALESSRTDRDYLYGRLFAIAEHLEQRALNLADEHRDTSAERHMQRFCDHPCTTWMIIEKDLVPYRARLKAKNDKTRKFLGFMRKQLDEVHHLFDPEEYESKRPLSGEWLLGYHCQRRELRKNPKLKRKEDAQLIKETT